MFATRSRPCLLHQIHRRTAPCAKLIGEEAYAEDVRSAELFLSGKQDEVFERLAARMEAASARMDCEEAAIVRDQIAALRRVRETQFVADESGRDVDGIACVRVSGVNLVMIRSGQQGAVGPDYAVLHAFVAPPFADEPAAARGPGAQTWRPGRDQGWITDNSRNFSKGSKSRSR